jgi:hypothetical protein
VSYKLLTGDLLVLSGSVVLAEGLDMFRPRAVATGRRRLPSDTLSFVKRTLVEWMSGG